MRYRRRRSEGCDLIALADHRRTMAALGKITEARPPVALAPVVDLAAERDRRRGHVALLEPYGPYDEHPFGDPA